MTIYGPNDVFILIAGNDLTPDTFELGEGEEQVMEEVRPYGSGWDKHVPIGAGKASLSMNGGLYDDRANAMLASLEQKAGVKQLVTYGLQTDAIGAEAAMLYGPLVAKWNRVADLGGITKANPEFVVSDAKARGRILHGLIAETADFHTKASSVDQATAPRLRSITISTSSLSTGSPATATVTTATAHGLETGDVVIITGHTSTPDINGQYTVTVTGPTTFEIAATVTGSPGGTGGSLVKVTSPDGFADLHTPELALGGHTGLNVRVLGSADNVTFAPIGTFATVTAVAATHAQRITITGPIPRYTAIDGDFTGAGSPSAIPFVVLHRNA